MVPAWFAFDFDGVICDSAQETGLTAWRAAHALWPDRVPARPTPDFLARFPRLRPVIETGYENVALVALLAAGHDDRSILDDFPRLCRAWMESEGLDRAELRRRFGAARDAWLASDPEGWLQAQGFFPGVVEAINALDAPRCIITTKEERFTRPLVEHAGLRIEPGRVYALEAFEGAGKRSVLEALAREQPGARLHFFEDRYPTLDRLRDLPDARLYLADWGYNTPEERARARADARIEVLDIDGFRAALAAAAPR